MLLFYGKFLSVTGLRGGLVGPQWAGTAVCSITGPSSSEVTVTHLQIHVCLHRTWATPAATFPQPINYAKNGRKLHFVSKQRLASGFFGICSSWHPGQPARQWKGWSWEIASVLPMNLRQLVDPRKVWKQPGCCVTLSTSYFACDSQRSPWLVSTPHFADKNCPSC